MNGLGAQMWLLLAFDADGTQIAKRLLGMDWKWVQGAVDSLAGNPTSVTTVELRKPSGRVIKYPVDSFGKVRAEKATVIREGNE